MESAGWPRLARVHSLTAAAWSQNDHVMRASLAAAVVMTGCGSVGAGQADTPLHRIAGGDAGELFPRLRSGSAAPTFTAPRS